ncbi:MAG: DNA gyrase inhibitor YacG [Caulobacteraceae bacterium]
MSTRTCPICRKAEPSPKYAPFCSRRCADVDLGRWFGGVYAVPVVEDDEDASFAQQDEH